MQRKPTPKELRYANKPRDIDTLLNLWNPTLIYNILSCVWSAYDRLYAEFPKHIDWSMPIENVERSLTSELEQEIQEEWDAILPFNPQHEAWEETTRSSAPARPPSYDIAFVWRTNRTVMWPLEAKVIQDDNDAAYNLKDYVENGVGRYLAGLYAPFANSGAMLAFLRSGQAEIVAENIALRLSTTLSASAEFSSRCHKTSTHRRGITNHVVFEDFCLHHLIMPLS